MTFRHMEATDALKSYAKEKIQRIRKYLPDPIAVHVVMSTERHNHRADINVQLHNGLKVAGHEATDDMYSAIDQVVQKIERQVRRYKEKLRTHKGKSTFDAVTWTHSVLAEEADAVESDGKNGEDASPALAAPGIVRKTEKFHASPMSVSEAIMQLNLLHEQFLVFRCDRTGGVNVVYRLNDGTFGLIETLGADADVPAGA
ncbi:MAG TPA: ribosome-associated translation inhibitor RaiA [Kofleriaceae bacterium]|nr:ribosome-associated translation inhibitor RaiA [Kofleriaceae bacterium]